MSFLSECNNRDRDTAEGLSTLKHDAGLAARSPQHFDCATDSYDLQKEINRSQHYKSRWKNNKRHAKRVHRQERAASKLLQTVNPQSVFNTIREVGDLLDKAHNVKEYFGNIVKTLEYKGVQQPFAQTFMSRLEELVILVMGLASAENPGSVCAAIAAFIKHYHHGGTCLAIFEWVKQALVEGMPDKIAQAFDVTPQAIFDHPVRPSEQTPDEVLLQMKAFMEPFVVNKQAAFETPEIHDFMANFRRALVDWKNVRNSQLWSNIGNVINILVAIGICPDLKENPIKLGNFVLFKAEAFKRQAKCEDILDMAVDTFQFFIERGYAAIINQDPSLLLHGTDEERNIENEYSLLMSCYPAVQAGQLHLLNEYIDTIKDPQEFDMRLQEFVQRLASKTIAETSPPRKKVLADYLTNMRQLAATYVIAQKGSSLRIKPLSVLVHGKSSVGKSTIMKIIHKVVCSANGFPSDSKYTCTKSKESSFDSDVKPWVITLFSDEACNTKPEFDKTPMSEEVTLISNNVEWLLRKAGVDEKGILKAAPKLYIVSTNEKSLNAHVFSCEPASILRRFEIILDVRLRPEFVHPETKGLNPAKMTSWCPDAWLIDVQAVEIIRDKKDSYVFRTLIRDASIHQVREFLIRRSREHYAFQNKFVATQSEIDDMEFCSHACPKHECFYCKGSSVHTEPDPLPEVPVSYPPPPPAFVDESKHSRPWEHFPYKRERPANLGQAWWYYIGSDEWKRCMDWDLETFFMEGGHLGEKTWDLNPSFWDVELEDFFDEDGNRKMTNEFGRPLWKCVHPLTRKFVVYDKYGLPTDEPFELPDEPFPALEYHPLNWVHKKAQFHPHDLAGALAPPRNRTVSKQAWFNFFDDPGPAGPPTILAWAKRQWVRTQVANSVAWEFSHVSDLKAAFEIHKKNILPTVLKTIGIGVSAYAIFEASVAVVRAIRKNPVDKQGSCHSQPNELDEGAIEPKRLPGDTNSNWLEVEPIDIPKSIRTKTMTFDDAVKKVTRSVCYAEFSYEDSHGHKKVGYSGIVPMQQNEWLMPRHMVDVGYAVTIRASRVSDNKVGFRFTQTIDEKNWVPMGADCALVRILSGGSQPELCRLLPLEHFPIHKFQRFHARMCRPSSGGNVIFHDFLVKNKEAFHSRHDANDQKGVIFDGLCYDMDVPTQGGFCGSPVIHKASGPAIVGFHIAGIDGSPLGVAETITLKEFEEASALLKIQDPLVVHSQGDMPTEKYGIKFGPVKHVPEHHSVKYLEQAQNGSLPALEVFGQHPLGTTTFRTNVKKSIISDAVATLMHLPRQHGAPCTYHINKHHVRDLSHIASPTGGTMDPELLRRASEDLTQKFLAFVNSDPHFAQMVHPYPMSVVLSGFDGVASLQPVKLATSMSHPIYKPKRNFLVESQESVQGISRPLEFVDDTFMEEFHRMRDILASGQRVYSFFSTRLKDESVKFDKDKIRVFAGCEFMLTVLIRMYYLPLVRLIQSSNGELECAVGINATSPQWDDLTKLVTTFGKDRMIAGDYKSYDKTMGIPVMRHAFEVLHNVARHCGYNEKQLKVMEGLATEVISPVYEHQGVYIHALGSNPSGHPLTVIINNLVNSLYFRYAYYDLHRGKTVPRFDERIKLICYGDDNLCSVSNEEHKFNHTTVAASLAKIGVTYTMADKRSQSVPLIPLDQCSFLKRAFRWDTKLEQYLAPLEEASISKSLHNYMKTKGSEALPAEFSANAIMGANREYWFHGREIFEQRRIQLSQILDEFPDVRSYVPNSKLKDYGDLELEYQMSGRMRSILEEPAV